jgi:hypothetical protein
MVGLWYGVMVGWWDGGKVGRRDGGKEGRREGGGSKQYKLNMQHRSTAKARITSQRH